jgi:hypothetical protein
MKKKAWKQLQKKTKTKLKSLADDVGCHPDDLEEQITWYLKEVPEQDKQEFIRRANIARKLTATWDEECEKFEKMRVKVDNGIEKLLE